MSNAKKEFVSRKDIIDSISEKTGFYKVEIENVLNALYEVVIEEMRTATDDSPSEIRLFTGMKIGAKRMPACIMPDPINGGLMNIDERLLPYCSYHKTFKVKLNGKDK